MSPVRVLVVDDSLTMRGLISAALKSDPEIEVVGTAADPIEARAAIKALNPDVITLDVEMPNMNGLEFLEKIMRLRPMPVVMVSTLTAAGTDVTLAALEIGAVDAVAKPAIASVDAFHDLIGKVKTAARSRVRARGDTPAAAEAPRAYRPNANHVLAVGSSTGGVEALLTVLSGFPANCPATVITQHMPATFTASFAARLDRVCAPTVTCLLYTSDAADDM
jgi:two-component system chemotaxis response regulator CheB